MTNVAKASARETPLPGSKTPLRPANPVRLVLPEPTPDAVGSKARRPDESERPVPTLIVDRSTLFRAGLTHILAHTRFRVAADCSSLDELPPKLLHHKHALLLLGLDPQSGCGPLADVMRLLERHSQLRVVMLGRRFDPEEALTAVTSGCDAYLAKDEVRPEVLLKSLELALLGAVVVSPGFSGVTVGEKAVAADEALASNTEPGAAGDHRPPPVTLSHRVTELSDRERLTLSHLMHGASNKQIARELGIAEATVKVHVKSLLRKIRVRNRTQAAMWGIEHLRCSPAARGAESPKAVGAEHISL